MPGKSRHGKGKYPHHIKKSKARQHHGANVSQPPVVTGTTQPVAAASPAVPASVPASTVKSRTASRTYITMELRTIGILTVIILVILIVLSRVLS
jgi:hypothetical protein